MNHIPESPVAIVGSRDFPDLEMVRAFVRSLPKGFCVISGGARGVDSVAENTAMDCGLAVRSYRPRGYGEHFAVERIEKTPNSHFEKWEPGHFLSFAVAAHTRNQWIVNDAGSVVAFWDGKSKGTKSTIDKAQAAGILFAVYTCQPQDPNAVSIERFPIPDSVTPST